MAPSILRRISKTFKSSEVKDAIDAGEEKARSKRFSFRPRQQDAKLPVVSEIHIESPESWTPTSKPIHSRDSLEVQPKSSVEQDHGSTGDFVLIAELATDLNASTTDDVVTTSSTQDEIIIAVMGMTGAGKSSFIATVSGEDVKVGHSLYSETSNVSTYRFAHKGRTYVLVDTPGFDDSSMSNDEVTKIVAGWLDNSFREGRRVNGIIYVHAITNPRMSGSAYQNIRMFKKICGDDALGNIIFATSFWDQVDPDRGEDRERELVSDQRFWANMIAKGSRTVRIRPDRDVCLSVIEMLTDQSSVALQVQQDTVNDGKDLEDITARLAILDPELLKVHEELQIQRAKEKEQLKAELEARAKAQRVELEKLKLEQAFREGQEKERLQRLEDRHQQEIREDRIRRAVERQRVEAEQRQLDEERRQAEERQEQASANLQKTLEEQNRLRNQRKLAEQIRQGREKEETARLEKLQYETQTRTKQRRERQSRIDAELKEQQRILAERERAEKQRRDYEEKLEKERSERQQAEEEIRNFERMEHERIEKERYEQWAAQQQQQNQQAWYGYPQQYPYQQYPPQQQYTPQQQYPSQQQYPPEQQYPNSYHTQPAHPFGCRCWTCTQGYR